MGGRVTVLLLRDVELDGCRRDVRLADGRIAEIGPRLAPGGDEIDGRGGALIPGLIDHHVHLLATAAARGSVSLAGAADPADLAAILRRAAAGGHRDVWLRGVGYHEHRGGALDRAALDEIVPDRPVRIQHQTGALWVLNSAALARLDLSSARSGVDPASGRIERADDWLRAQLAGDVPDLAPIGRALAAAGVTGVGDASVTNNDGVAGIFADAQASGALRQRVMMMSGGPLAPPGGLITVGPVKIVLDDHDLPPLDSVTDRIADARRWGRRVAVHCVTAGELAMALAAFGIAGARPGDRIEHGGVVPAESIPVLAALGLTVVTQSAFPCERGDRYLAEVDRREIPDLYRCASLLAAAIPVAGSSDAPYATIDPWAAMRAAVARRTTTGRTIGPDEAVDARRALGLYLGGFADPGGPSRRIEVGAVADLCLLVAPLADVLASLPSDAVATTLVAGRVVYAARP